MIAHESMCTGKDLKRSLYNKEKADFHRILERLYKLERKDQLIFMAAFNQMVENAKDNKKP